MTLSKPIVVAVSDREKSKVRNVQLLLRLEQSGEMDTATKMHIRGAQSLFKIPVTGILDTLTYDKIMTLGWADEE